VRLASTSPALAGEVVGTLATRVRVGFCREAVPPFLSGYDRGLAAERCVVVDFKGSHFEREIIFWGVRWYVAYPISYRQLEEIMEEPCLSG